MTRRKSGRCILTGGEMADLIVEGHTTQQVARMAQITDARVVQKVKALTGCTPSQWRIANGWANQATPPAMVERIQTFVQNHLGMSRADMAQDLGVTVKSIDAVVAMKGLVLARGKLRDEIEEIARLYLEGKTTVELADRYGVSERMIRDRLDDAQVERRGWSSRAGRAARAAAT